MMKSKKKLKTYNVILLTGVSGFIGKNLYNKLQDKFGIENVIALTSKPVKPGRYLLHNGYNFSRDFFIENYCGDISVIVHAGAFTPKSRDLANDWVKCNENIINTHKLLSANFPSLRKIIFLSTLDVYGQSTDKISESSPVVPVTLYAQSKLYCEKLINSFVQEKGLTSQVLRIGHTYGPGEEAYKKLIPSVIKSLLMRESPQVWGTGEELRAYIYIDDVVQSIIRSVDYDEFLGEINVVSGTSLPVRDIVNKLISISNINTEITFLNSNVTSASFSFDNSKLSKKLLTSEINLEEGLKKEWQYLEKRFNENLF